MTMVADTVDAVIGGDTPRHTRTGDDRTERRDFSDALVWIAEHAPGPRVVVGSKAPAATESAWLAC